MNKTPYELGYESETLALTFADNPYPRDPMTQEAKDWISGKCQAINDYKTPPKRAPVYLYDEFGPCQPM